MDQSKFNKLTTELLNEIQEKMASTPSLQEEAGDHLKSKLVTEMRTLLEKIAHHKEVEKELNKKKQIQAIAKEVASELLSEANLTESTVALSDNEYWKARGGMQRSSFFEEGKDAIHIASLYPDGSLDRHYGEIIFDAKLDKEAIKSQIKPIIERIIGVISKY